MSVTELRMCRRNALPTPVHWSMLTWLLVAAALSCDGARIDRGTAVSDSSGISILNHDLSRIDQLCRVSSEPDIVIGSADGGPEYELYRVFGASQLSDRRIVVVNQGSHELRFYDATGHHLLSTGRGGRGPGEFENAFLLWVLPGDTAWVGDHRPWQFLLFGPDGQWVRTVRPQPLFPNPPGVVEVLGDGRMLLATRPITSEGENWSERYLTIVVHGPDGTVQDTIGTYPNGRWGMLKDRPRLGLYPLFESFFRIDALGTTVVTGHGSQPQVSIHTLEGSLVLKRIVRWNAGTRTITRGDIDAEHQRLADQYKDVDPVMRRELLDPLISQERPIANQFPAFVSLRLGRDGRIWVQAFVKPTEPPPAQWYVFNADGTFGCRAQLPDVDELFEFGPDYMLALQRDDLGIERVVKYSILTPVSLN